MKGGLQGPPEPLQRIIIVSMLEGMRVACAEPVDSVAGQVAEANNILQTCAPAARITLHTLGQLPSFEDPVKVSNMRMIYNNVRFIRLESWAGLPYVYNLVAITAFSTAHERSYFVANVVRVVLKDVIYL
ncbi:hypothetical protein FQN55_004281, partial [Onygenales sp. PD_40]